MTGRTDRSRELRTGSTDAERALWRALRMKQVTGYRFRRQVPIGRYFADFVCLNARLIVEVDGGQHASQIEKDTERTAWLEAEGFIVLRFWNNEVFQQTNAVVEEIRRWLEERGHPHPSLPPSRGKG